MYAPDLFPDARLHEVELPFAVRSLPILILEDPWGLLGKRSTEALEEIYWGYLWPSALALSDALLKRDIILPPTSEPALDLGCGAGLVGIAAALANPKLTMVGGDFVPRSVMLAQENAKRNGIATRYIAQQLDWRNAPPRQHDVIVAADCLYQPDATREVSTFLSKALKRHADARAIIADPDRWSARNFSYLAQEAGFAVEESLHEVPFIFEQDGPHAMKLRQNPGMIVVVYTLRWAEV